MLNKMDIKVRNSVGLSFDEGARIMSAPSKMIALGRGLLKRRRRLHSEDCFFRVIVRSQATDDCPAIP